MKKILLFGSGALSVDDHAQIRSAAALRTEQFRNALEKEYELTLFLIGAEHDAGKWQNAHCFTIAPDSPDLLKKAREISRGGDFLAAIGVNTFPAFVAAQTLPGDLPLWADLNGWIMAEMQAQAAELKHNEYLPRGWEQEKAILLRGDGFSAVSAPQQFAVYGELAALGRVNREHFRREMVSVIPNVAPEPGKETAPESAFLKSIPENAFLIAQIGGFNNWVDEATLFAALEKAMAADPEIYFATTGGKIAHVANSVFERFEQKVQASEYRDRFQLLGWISTAEIPALYARSDLGIMADTDCLETQTGARNRLNEMMAYGLPFVATRGAEITHDIAAWQCGEIVESGNVDGLAAAILKLKAAPQLRKEYGERAQEVCRTVLTPGQTVRPLLAWLGPEEPPLLHQFRTPLGGANLWQQGKAAAAFWRERGAKAFFQKVRTRLRRK